MGLHHALAALFCVCVTLMGTSHAQDSIPADDHWQAVWPNIPIPSTHKDLFKSHGEDGDILNPETLFFDHDLYPGKTMILQFKNSQPIGIVLWAKGDIKDNNEKLKGFDYEVCMRKPSINGEHKYCAKSLETMIGFATSKLGKNIKALSGSFVDKQNQYTIEGVQDLGDKAVMCHRLNFQKVVFYCHQIHETTAYMVAMVAADGSKSKALAVCHHDSSAMNAELLYKLLKVKPGVTPVCHFLGNEALVWVPNMARDNANMAS